MSTLLWIVAGYIVLDRMATIALIGRPVVTTRGIAALSVLTGACIVTILLVAALGGVTP